MLPAAVESSGPGHINNVLALTCTDLCGRSPPHSARRLTRKNLMATPHNHRPAYGRKIDGCPRCTELKEGAEPVSQPWRTQYADRKRMQQSAHEKHFAPGGPHQTGRCGPVCTFGD